MTWAARDKETRRNRELGERLLAEAWERAYMWLVGQQGGSGDINQTELAPKLGVSQPTVSSWTATARRTKSPKAYLPNARNLLLLPKALGVNPMWLFYGLGEPTDAAVVGPSPSRRMALQAQYRLLQDLHDWTQEREAEVLEQMHQAPVSEVADTIASARHAAQPIPREADNSPGFRDRPAGRDGGTPPRQSAAEG